MAGNRKRAAKKDPWAHEELLFSAKSKLLEVDLQKYFADPQAWALLDESEKTQLRALLPSHIAFNEDGSIPQHFLKYDADWRNALRQFQVDLEAGRYDADWLEEAAQAMEERAAGEFDDFKEREFEEFWGQKQKLSHDVIAGDMTTLKLEVLVKAGVYKAGDVWSFSRTAGRGKKMVVVEKDVHIIAIDNGKLTFAIPPGRSKYLVETGAEKDDVMTSVENFNQPPKITKVPTDELDGPAEKINPKASLLEPVDKVNDNGINGLETERNVDRSVKEGLMDLDIIETNVGVPNATSGDIQFCSNEDNGDKHVEPSEPKTPHTVEEPTRATSPPRKRITRSQNIVNGSHLAKGVDSPKVNSASKRTSSHAEPKNPTKPNDPSKPITITITTPAALESKILEVDGRIQSSGKSNAWKTIRCKRDNQDMGSLWEMREEYYVRRLSQ